MSLRGDAADRHAVPQGDPEARLRRLEEGVVARVEVLAPLEQQRRYPRRVIAVEAPGQAEKGVAGAGPLDHLQAQPAAGAAHGRLPCGVDAPSKTGDRQSVG